jgi:hypothetical protein
LNPDKARDRVAGALNRPLAFARKNAGKLAGYTTRPRVGAS